MYNREQACFAASKQLPSLEALLRLQSQIEKQVQSVQEKRPADMHKWLAGHEVDRLAKEISTCLCSPTGFDLLWLLLPEIIKIVKTGNKKTAPP